MVLKTNIDLSTSEPECRIYIDQKVNAENLNAYNIYVVVIYVIGRENKGCWVNR